MNSIAKISRFPLILFMILSITIPVFAQSYKVPLQDDPIQEKISKLLDDYKNAVEYELQYGETIEVDDPRGGKEKLLVGESELKIKMLWGETRRQINELKARPLAEREKVVQLIRRIEPGYVSYSHQTRLPYYSENAIVEIYDAEKDSIIVDIAYGQIIEIIPLRLEQYSLAPTFSQSELEIKAVEFINMVTKGIDFGKLTPRFTEKEQKTFFFRWEDNTKKLSGGMSPFVQVSFSRGGDFLNYVNTLPFSENETISAPLAVTFEAVTGMLLES